MAENEPVWRRLLNGWMFIAGRFGFVQTLLLLFLIYLFLIGPISLGMRLARRDLLSKRGIGDAASAWIESDSAPSDLERSKTQS